MTDAELLPYITQRHVVAGTLWAEARSEPIEGRIAVGNVIRTRARVRRQTTRQVCLAPSQFSCWADAGGRANHLALMAILRALPAITDSLFRECLWIADGLSTGVLLDNVHGADHYLTTQLYDSAPPAWAHPMPVVCVIGRHTFLRSP